MVQSLQHHQSPYLTCFASLLPLDRSSLTGQRHFPCLLRQALQLYQINEDIRMSKGICYGSHKQACSSRQPSCNWQLHPSPLHPFPVATQQFFINPPVHHASNLFGWQAPICWNTAHPASSLSKSDETCDHLATPKPQAAACLFGN